MRAYSTLVRRELGSYFGSVTGYVLISAVLFLLGLSFVELLTRLNTEPTDSPVTELFFITMYFWLILLLTAPVITMRSFALEKSSGTFETLMTSPVTDLQVVLAKFTGSLIFYLFTWLPLLLYLLVVHRFSNDPQPLSAGTLFSTILGLLLIGAVYMSMGCFASALTQSQIVATMINYAFGITLFVLSLRALRAAPSSGWAANFFDHISMRDHMENFARGIIDTRPLIYYVSVTLFFLFLTLKVVESRRWK